MTLRQVLGALARRTPLLRSFIADRDRLVSELAARRDGLLSELVAAQADCRILQNKLERRDREHGFVPPGHFYSPIPDFSEIERYPDRLFPDPPPRTLPGIDLREGAQRALVEQLLPFYPELPFTPEAQPGVRYSFENGAFSYADAIFLYLMLRHLRPRRIIEIGSGHSSGVILDTIESFLGGEPEVTFVEPYPELLRTILRPGDAERVTILPTRLQDVPLDRFSLLAENDVLFIDSTHVAKIGSDVALLFNEILPSLRPGVRVHFHDIFYPFEYPRFWFAEGRAWNEAYLLRAFLQFNKRFGIELWNHFLLTFDPDFFSAHMPLCLRNPGASLWLRVTDQS